MIEINREHPDYRHLATTLRMYRDLYAGGHQMKHRASEYLLRRQKEPLDVYAERLSRVFYENYVGSIVDWYTATLFRRAPSLHLDGGSEASREFFGQLASNCDCRGTSLSDFFRQCFVEMLICGRSHILIDFPRTAKRPANRAEEDAAGASRAYLVRYGAEDLINWSYDENGDYEWVVLRQSVKRQVRVDSPKVATETYWYYFDKHAYETYKQVEIEGEPKTMTRIAQGTHALSHQQRVPLMTMHTNDGMWLLNKASLLQLEHFNKSNALGWAITMGLFAMPVVYTDREWTQIVGESYYIQLGPQDRFGWTEPEGKVYQIAADNLDRLREEIYRVCYLAQASGEMVGGHAQSAASKELDFAITQDVLKGYGDLVKSLIRGVLTAVNDAREDGLSIHVSGLDQLDITDFGTELRDASQLLQTGINSPTLKQQIYQRLAFKYLSDIRQETKDQIAREIDEQLKGK